MGLSKIIILPLVFGVVLSLVTTNLTGCTQKIKNDLDTSSSDLWHQFEAFNNLRGHELTVWEDTVRDSGSGSCNSPPQWAIEREYDAQCEDTFSQLTGKTFHHPVGFDGNPLTCCQFAAEQGMCKQGNFGRNQCQAACWKKLELTRVECTINNWDTICPTLGSGSTCGGVAEADENGGACWALYEWNALLESCVDNGSFKRSEKDQLWDGVNGQYQSISTDGFNQRQIDCLTGLGGDNVVQTRKKQALPAIVDNALNCPSTQSLTRFLGALQTVRETPSSRLGNLPQMVSDVYGFNVWQTFFPNGGIVDKLAQSMCFDGLGNVCSV